MPYPVVIHIGLHKTATGVLQRQFFPAVKGLNFLTTKNPAFKRFVQRVTTTDPVYYSPSAALDLIAPFLQADQINVLSNESLSALPYSGVIEFGLDHRTPILQNLKATFPEARILVVLRRQDGMARSLYRQYLKSGGTRSIERFYGLGSEGAEFPIVPLERFLYSPYVDYLKREFRDVKLMTYESFVEDRTAFAQEIAEYIGVQCPLITFKTENATSLSPAMLDVSRFLNIFFRSLVNQAGFIPGIRMKYYGIPRKVSPVQLLHDRWPLKPNQQKHRNSNFYRIPAEILSRCHDDNSTLQQLCPELRLGEQGYLSQS